jgi:excisionase family DNA binding protein
LARKQAVVSFISGSEQQKKQDSTASSPIHRRRVILMAVQTLDPGKLSARSRNQLEALRSALRGGSLMFCAPPLGGEKLDVPDAIQEVMRYVVEQIVQGRTVRVAAENEALTTTQAADVLNVSRPHVVKLMKEGKLPYHMVGSHRRAYLEDVRAYKAQQRQRSLEAMQELADLDQELGLGY